MSYLLNFNKAEIITHFKNLSHHDNSIQKRANDYLNAFKQSDYAFELSLELLDDCEFSNQFLGSIILHQVIKEKSVYLLNNQDEFQKNHKLIFNNLLSKYRNSNYKIVERLCYSISTLTCIGLYNNIITIKDILLFASESHDNELISLLILENVVNELSDLEQDSFPYQFFSVINEKLKLSSSLIINFVTPLLCTYSNKDENIIKRVFNLLISWSKNNLSVFDYPDFLSLLLKSIQESTVNNISDIIINSINNLPKAKYHSEYDIYEIDKLLLLFEDSKMLLIFELIKYIENLSSTLDKQSKYLSCVSSIFSCIIDNFPFILFFKSHQISQISLKLLFLFISESTKEISSKFNESLNEIRDFILRGYKLDNYDNKEKEDYFNFNLKLLEGILNHSQLNSLKITLKKNKIESSNENSLNGNEIMFIEDCYEVPEEINNNESIPFISCEDYRKVAEDMFYNISMINLTIFNEEGNKFYFTWIVNTFNEILKYADIDKDKYIKLAEVVFLLLKSIADILNNDDLTPNYFNQTITYILSKDSSILQNERFSYSFLIFLDSTSFCIAKDPYLSLNIISYLLELAKNANFQAVASKIIYEICEWFNNIEDNKIHELIIKSINENYQSYSNNSIWFLTKAFCTAKQSHSEAEGMMSPEKIEYYKNLYISILNIPIESNTQIEKLLQSKQNFNNNEYNELRNLCIKNTHCLEIIIKECYFLDKQAFKYISDLYFSSCTNFNSLIIDNYYTDKLLMTSIINLLIKLFSNLEEEVSTYFEYYNSLLIKLFSKNNQLNKCVKCISCLWGCYSKAAIRNKTFLEYISSNLLFVTKILIDEIHKSSIELNIIINLQYLAGLWTSVSESMVLVNIDVEEKANIVIKFIANLLSCLKYKDPDSFCVKEIIICLNRIVVFPIIGEFKSIVFRQIVYGVMNSLSIIDTSSISSVSII